MFTDWNTLIYEDEFDIPLEDLQAIGIQETKPIVTKIVAVEKERNIPVQPIKEATETRQEELHKPTDEVLYLKYTEVGYKKKPVEKDYMSIQSYFKSCEATPTTYRQLADLIGKGHTMISALYKDNKGEAKECNVKEMPMLTLDSDEGNITKEELTQLIYKDYGIMPVISCNTFSWKQEHPKFRLIYRLEKYLNVEEFKMLYKAILYKYAKYLDKSTCNVNRIWNGTKYPVAFNEDDIPISYDTVGQIIADMPTEQLMTYSSAFKEATTDINITGKAKHVSEDLKALWIKKECFSEICEAIIRNVNCLDFVRIKYGWQWYKQHNDEFVGACPLHGGTCKTAFHVNIRKNIYKCFSDCEDGGGIIKIAKIYYNTNNFPTLAKQLIYDFNLAYRQDWFIQN